MSSVNKDVQIVDVKQQQQQNNKDKKTTTSLLIAICILFVCSVVLSVIGIIFYNKLVDRQKKLPKFSENDKGELTIEMPDGDAYILQGDSPDADVHYIKAAQLVGQTNTTKINNGLSENNLSTSYNSKQI